jgi:hypothetical protein
MTVFFFPEWITPEYTAEVINLLIGRVYDVFEEG